LRNFHSPAHSCKLKETPQITKIINKIQITLTTKNISKLQILFNDIPTINNPHLEYYNDLGDCCDPNFLNKDGTPADLMDYIKALATPELKPKLILVYNSQTKNLTEALLFIEKNQLDITETDVMGDFTIGAHLNTTGEILWQNKPHHENSIRRPIQTGDKLI